MLASSPGSIDSSNRAWYGEFTLRIQMWVCASSLLGHAHSDAITEVQHERDQIERGVVWL